MSENHQPIDQNKTDNDGVATPISEDLNYEATIQGLEQYLEGKAARTMSEKEGPAREAPTETDVDLELHERQRKALQETLKRFHRNATIGAFSTPRSFRITDVESGPEDLQKLIESFGDDTNPNNRSVIYGFATGRFGDGKTRMTQMLIDQAIERIKEHQVEPKLPKHLPQTFIFSDVGPAGGLRRALLRMGPSPEVEVLSSSHPSFPNSDWKFSWHIPSAEHQTNKNKQKLVVAQSYSKQAKKNPLAFLEDKTNKKTELIRKNPFFRNTGVK
jgi:hypothetical protein